MKNDVMETDINSKIRKEYDAGLSDSSIARELHVCTRRVREWREKYDLPSNYRRISHITSRDHMHFKTLYELGCNDNEIAEIYNVSSRRIQYWRSTNKLPINSCKNNELPQYTDLVMRKLYDIGLSDIYICGISGLNLNQVLEWRKLNNLPHVNHKRRHRILAAMDKIPEDKIFDEESLFYSSEILDNVIRGDIE